MDTKEFDKILQNYAYKSFIYFPKLDNDIFGNGKYLEIYFVKDFKNNELIRYIKRHLARYHINAIYNDNRAYTFISEPWVNRDELIQILEIKDPLFCIELMKFMVKYDGYTPFKINEFTLGNNQSDMLLSNTDKYSLKIIYISISYFPYDPKIIMYDGILRFELNKYQISNPYEITKSGTYLQFE